MNLPIPFRHSIQLRLAAALSAALLLAALLAGGFAFYDSYRSTNKLQDLLYSPSIAGSRDKSSLWRSHQHISICHSLP